MDVSYYPAPGDPIAPDALTLHRARQLYRVASSGVDPYVSFVEARRASDGPFAGGEVVVCDVGVEVPQRRVHDIRRRERVAVLVLPGDAHSPVPLALRTDFPTVPHTHVRIDGQPVPLCLSDQPASEVLLHWTPTGFWGQLRTWLARTARGEVHGADQPLEPLLLTPAAALIVPHDLAPSHGDTPEYLLVHARDGGDGRLVYVAERPDALTVSGQPIRCAAVVIGGNPQPHGVIRQAPRTLGDLHKFLRAAGVDVRAQLDHILTTWGLDRQKLALPLMIIVILPKTRHADGAVEEEELHAFLAASTIGAVGEALGLWQVKDGYAGRLLDGDTGQIGHDVPLAVLNPVRTLSREQAARFNGHPDAASPRIVAVGLGALGSHVFMNLVRAGYGDWTLVDHDHLLPHNLARHALDGRSIGSAKAVALAASANRTIAGAPIAAPIVADVLAPGDQADAVRAALAAAEVVVDMSAALAVARHLARDVSSAMRRLSLFLNPGGTDFVLLAEDRARHVPLDWAEMLYYRHLLREPMLAHHHADPSGRVRYGGSCRDVSGTISQDHVALLAAIGGQGLRKALDTGEATIAVWRSHDDGSVGVTRACPTPLVQHAHGEWTVCTDAWLLDRVMRARAEKLPNETGGVFIGSYDMVRRIVYVIDIVESPPDSTEWPTSYIRGCQGLAERLGEVEARTGGLLRYAGEWHTHPSGYGPEPSQHDREAFGWLGAWIEMDDRPAIMLIAGETPAWYVGAMP